jgi:uncharacterized membrane-anchored protein YjiN (DUF445 family)
VKNNGKATEEKDMAWEDIARQLLEKAVAELNTQREQWGHPAASALEEAIQKMIQEEVSNVARKMLKEDNALRSRFTEQIAQGLTVGFSEAAKRIAEKISEELLENIH